MGKSAGQEAHHALNIAVVDDDPAMRDSLATIFTLEGFHVLTFASGKAFLDVAKRLNPDCVLLDVHMPSCSGLEVLEAISEMNFTAPIIMISAPADIPMAVAAIKAGAHDFLEKPFDADDVIARTREAVRLSRERALGASTSSEARRAAALKTLTSRERDVLQHIMQGASNKETGRSLGISPRTVEAYRAHVMEKLGARNTAGLMRIVLTGGENPVSSEGVVSNNVSHFAQELKPRRKE